MLATTIAVALLFGTVTHSLDGTLVSIKEAAPAQITLNADRQFQTLTVGKRAVIERESDFSDGRPATTQRIALSDLTPGESVRLQIDAQGCVTRVHAVAEVERARVRSVEGNTIVLEDGTALTIGSVLRFVDERGKPSATPAVHAGETVLLYRHPETKNVYRITSVPRPALRKQTDRSKF